MIRERTTWNTDLIAKTAGLTAKPRVAADDPLTMNQQRNNPPGSKYITGDPSTFGEDVHPSAGSWEAEYAGGQVKRNEIGLPEFRSETFNHSEKTASEVELVKKAALCLEVATALLGKTASVSSIEDQAHSLMFLPDAELFGTYSRLANQQGDQDQQGQQQKQAQDQDQQAQDQQQKQAQDQQAQQGQQQDKQAQDQQAQQDQAQGQGKQAQQQQLAQIQQQIAQLQQQAQQIQQQAQGQQQVAQGQQVQAQQDQQAQSQQQVQASRLANQIQQQATQLQQQANQMLQQAQQLMQQAQGQQQQVAQGQQVQQQANQVLQQQAQGQQGQFAQGQFQQQAQDADLIDAMLNQQAQEPVADMGIQFEEPVFDGDAGLGAEDNVLQQLFASNPEVRAAKQAQGEDPDQDQQGQQQQKQANVRTASTRTVGTRPTQGVTSIGGLPSASSGGTASLEGLWSSSPDVRGAFGLPTDR